MRTIHLLAAVAAVLVSSAPALAKPLQTHQFKANAAITLDRTRAYLLVRSPGVDLKLVRTPTQSEWAAYLAERAEALAKARAKYPRKLESYEADRRVYDGAAKRGERYPKPERPVEPTDANLAFKAIESDNFVTIWGGRVFDKGGTRTAHLIAVPPGTYRIYGQLLETQNGASGFCLCMGSVEFDAAAGTITDMGTMRYPIAEALRDKAKPSWNGLTPGKGGLTAMRVEPADASVHVPAKLAGLPRVTASYRAAGKMNNFFGVMVNRLTALPGVLAYRRDEVIDERTGTAVGAH